MDPKDAAGRVRASFARQSMMETLGAELVSVEPGEILIRAPILPGSRQQQGFAHAALSFAIGDSAAGYAALSLLDQGFEVVTAEMRLHLLAPGKGTHLVARGKVVRPGRRLVVVEAQVHDDEETHIAMLTGTMVPVRA